MGGIARRGEEVGDTDVDGSDGGANEGGDESSLREARLDGYLGRLKYFLFIVLETSCKFNERRVFDL